MPFKKHEIIFFFPENKYCKKVYVPTLAKIFRNVTGNTLFFIWPDIIIADEGGF